MAATKKTDTTQPSTKAPARGGRAAPRAKGNKPAPKTPASPVTPQTPTTPPVMAPTTAPTTASPKPMTCLDAAHAVLVRLNKPMRITDIMAQMVDRELWKSPGGLTPDATLAAAVLRDMKKNGESSRFRRVDRGFYAAREWDG